MPELLHSEWDEWMKSVRADSVMTHLGYLDALRGIAVLGVITVHCGILSQQTGPLADLFFSGQRGVQLFYVVSAFTLCRSLDLRHDGRRNFLIRRFFRVAPLFYVAVGINLWIRNAILIPIPGARPLNRIEIASAIFFLNGLSPRAINTVAMGGWSIAVETTFYLLLPVIFTHFGTLRKCLWLFAISACVCLGLSQYFAQTASDSMHQQYFSFLYFPVEFPVFLLGIIAYLIWRDHLSAWSKHSELIEGTTISALFFVASVLMFGNIFPLSDGQLYCSSLFFVPLLLALAMRPWRLIVNPLTIYLGKISYSMYLLHFFILYEMSKWADSSNVLRAFAARFVFHQVGGFFIVFAITTVTTALLASITYPLIERPGMTLGRSLIQRLESHKASRLVSQS